MKPWAKFSLQLMRHATACVGSLVLWTCWLALSLMLVAQIWILGSRELALPGFALRQIEAQLAESGLRATFGRASFDPTGRILIEDVRVSLPVFSDPVLIARQVFVRVNPAPLFAGRIDPREVRLSGVTVFAPAMLSPTGRAEELLRDFEAAFVPSQRTVELHQLAGRFFNLAVTAHGTLVFANAVTPRPLAAILADFTQRQFPMFCRQALDLAPRLAQLDDPALHLQFSASAAGAAAIDVRASARGVNLAAPLAIEADHLLLATRVLLFGDTTASDLEITAERVRLPSDTTLNRLRARVLGRLQLAGPAVDLREILLTADSVNTAGSEVRALSAQIHPRTLPALEASVVATVLGAPLAIEADANLGTRSGTVRFRGRLASEILDLISARVGTNVRRFFDFQTFSVDRGEAVFGDGFAFERLAARVTVPESNAYGVALQGARATIELTPGFFSAPEVFARIGENHAEGSYEQDLRSNRFRFLLSGQLRPLAISGWFKEWWPNFFRQLEFPVAGPLAAVDVAGVWREGGKSHVFVWADVERPVVRGAALDRVRTRLFIRPGFIDGLELLATRGEREATGVFTYRADRFTQAWHTLDLDLESNLDLKIPAQIIGPVAADIFAPLQPAQPPEVKLRGQFAGAAAPGGANVRLDIAARTAGDFRYHGFPLQDVALAVKLDRGEITLNNITGSFAGGAVTGHVRIWGTGPARRLGFDLALEDAALGQAATTLGEYLAARRGEPPPTPGKFIREKASVRVSLAASAEGAFADTFSYRGTGSAMLRGAEIGEVPLLGSLSALLRFTALRFTEARTNFKIDGPRLQFPEFTLRGSNSAIDAHGVFALDRQQLDFNAKLFPFQESDSLIKSVVGAVLTPLSNAFEVKLTGSLAKPNWVFAMGQAGLFRIPSAPAEPAVAEPAGRVTPAPNPPPRE